ncbi:hypothetical protein LTR08_004435 [Meristemomyces frigidus]|nr:hypothetical protein LTR08_004435 [Meristemomyces frigidus]
MTSLLDTPTLIQTAKLIAVPLPFALAGYSFAFSQNAVPHLYNHSAEISTPLLKKIYHGGAIIVVPGGLFSLITTAYLAYAIPSQRTTWTTAAGSLFCLSLWTPLVMIPSNIRRLIEISESPKMQERASANLEARQLLTKWVQQNYLRVGLLLVAGVAGLKATVVV